MADVILPDDVRDFILGHIDSVAELELLLLLRNHAEQNWTIGAVAKRLYVSEAMAAEALARLHVHASPAPSGAAFAFARFAFLQ